MAEEPDIDLVLITGAGASRAFGANQTKLPLMGDWANFLVGKMIRHPNAIEITGLQQGLAGPQFETVLGEFLSRAEGFYRAEGLMLPLSRISGLAGDFMAWYRNAASQLQQITGLIHESLYEQFNTAAINPYGAGEAYRELFSHVGISRTSSVVYATTNYDALGEQALGQFGFLPDSGEFEVYGPTQNHLRTTNLLDGIPRTAPVLHLHGKLGWFRRTDDPAPIFTRVETYSRDWGVPIVMLPDPQKTYENDDVLSLIWSQFESALRRAKRVLVLGHSLQDALVLKALVNNVREPKSRLAITYYLPDPQAEPTVRTLIQSKFASQATMIPIHFGVDPTTGAKELDQWITGTRHQGIA